jgi:hypothetical protein
VGRVRLVGPVRAILIGWHYCWSAARTDNSPHALPSQPPRRHVASVLPGLAPKLRPRAASAPADGAYVRHHGLLGNEAGTWNITFTGRNSTADHHYNGTVYQVQRQTEQTYVVNRQNSMTATVSYQLTNRVSLNAGIPFVEASWGIPSPRAGGPSARANENARGIGDITTLALAVVSPASAEAVLMIGGGVKFHTGDSGATDVFPDNQGLNNLSATWTSQ